MDIYCFAIMLTKTESGLTSTKVASVVIENVENEDEALGMAARNVCNNNNGFSMVSWDVTILNK